MNPSGLDEIEVSVVIPALNEGPNLVALMDRLHQALGDRKYQVLLIDDGSEDGTPQICAQLQRRFPLELHVRSNPANGLSGAVLFGLARARGKYLLVMDADLQHPPEQAPSLLAPLESGEADFALGSRYVAGGSTDGQWGALRRINSQVATLLARPFAGSTRDPMSGFFALPRQTYQRADRLNPIGYKIALELMCKCRVRRVCEVPIRFGLRQAGDSKLDLAQQFRYLDHLSRLYDFCFPRVSPWVKFVVATACAWLAAFALYVRLVAHHFNPVLAPSIAFAGAAVLTAAFHARTLRLNRQARAAWRDWIDFALVIVGEWSICTLCARWVAFHIEDLTVVEFFLVTFGAAAVARYTLRKRLAHNLRGVRLASTQPNPAEKQFRRAA